MNKTKSDNQLLLYLYEMSLIIFFDLKIQLSNTQITISGNVDSLNLATQNFGPSMVWR